MTSPRPIIETATDALPYECSCDHATDDSYVVILWEPSRKSDAPAQLRALSAAMNRIGYRLVRGSAQLARGASQAQYVPRGTAPTAALTESNALLASLRLHSALDQHDPTTLAHYETLLIEPTPVRQSHESHERAAVRTLNAWRRGESEVTVTRVTTAEQLTPDRVDWATVPRAPSGESGQRVAPHAATVRLTKRAREALTQLVGTGRYRSQPDATEAALVALSEAK